jgi:hypothetical protein
MISIRGIYTGSEIKPLEDIRVQPNVQVIITFLENISDDTETEKQLNKEDEFAKNPTDLFLEKCGGWQDTRRPDEIIEDIYASRTISYRGSQLFQEHV